jgi:hypothetical protein
VKNPHKTPTVAASLMLILMLGSAAGIAQAGDRHVARTRQGPAGRSLEAQRSRSYDPATGTYQGGASRTVTGVNGQTVSRSREVTREDGQATVTRQTTGPDGQTSTYQRSRGDGQAEVVRTGPDGQTFSRSRSVESSDQGVTVQTQSTGPQGGSRDRSVTYSPAGGE